MRAIAARIAVLGTGAVIAFQYFRDQKKRLASGPRRTVQSERDQ